MLPCKKGQIVWIRWQDAVGDSTRSQIEDARKAQLAVNLNIGWILDENAERVVLAHGTSTSGEIDHLVIPVANILERSYLVPPRAKAAK